MCDLEIFILLRDPERDVLYQYNSGTAETNLFTIDNALMHLKRLSEIINKIKVFDDTDYDQLKITYNRGGSPHKKNEEDDMD